MAGDDAAQRAGVVLAGGRSTRMGAPKAALEWHGSTLLWRTVEIVRRAGCGQVVVVRSPGQRLPPLPAHVLLGDDGDEGLGPLQALAVGLALAAGAGARVAFACSVDLPFLHPAYVRWVLRALDGDVDVVLPVARGFRQPLAAGYRTALAPTCAGLVAAGRLRPAALFEAVRTLRLDEQELLADRELRAGDPGLLSVVNVNDPREYAAARARPAPLVTLGGAHVRAATVAGLRLDPGVQVLLDGRPAGPQTPLVEGDVVRLAPPRPR